MSDTVVIIAGEVFDCEDFDILIEQARMINPLMASAIETAFEFEEIEDA